MSVHRPVDNLLSFGPAATGPSVTLSLHNFERAEATRRGVVVLGMSVRPPTGGAEDGALVAAEVGLSARRLDAVVVEAVEPSMAPCQALGLPELSDRS